MSEQPRRILQYWFGELDAQGFASAQQQALWFKSGEDTDAYIRTTFGAQVEAAVAGRLDDWLVTDTGLMALVILLDQFTRNIYRDTPAAFSGDHRALDHAENAVDSGRHLHLPAIYRSFVYLPFEHSEKLADQDRSVMLFDTLVNDFEGDQRLLQSQRYAVAHRDVIARFGRFPHRNEILGRDSSAEEIAYLKKHGGF